MKRSWKIQIVLMIVGICIAVMLLEVILRFLPVNEGLRVQPVTSDDPIFHFQPNRESMWSREWNFSLKNVVKTNNEGFVSPIDYLPGCNLPTLAVIGDSYIEALHIPSSETVQASLRKELQPKVRVYSFGASGAPLSQYLVFARHAAQRFCASNFVITVVGNDFDESILRQDAKPGFHYYDLEGKDNRLVRVDYSVPLTQSILRQSALFMYLVTNVVPYVSLREKKDDYVGNTSREATFERVAQAQKVVDIFLDTLASTLSVEPRHILFAVDAPRPEIYLDTWQLNKGGESFFSLLREYFIQQARRRGYETIDLIEPMRNFFLKTGERLEFPNDSHWNGRGHLIVADEVKRSKMFVELNGK